MLCRVVILKVENKSKKNCIFFLTLIPRRAMYMPRSPRYEVKIMDTRLLSGTLDMMILQVVSREPSYGYMIVQTVMAGSGGYFEVKEGSLYPALHKMERQGFLSSYWVDTQDGRRRKYYRITAAGSKALAEKQKEWTSFSTGVNGILGGPTSEVAR